MFWKKKNGDYKKLVESLSEKYSGKQKKAVEGLLETDSARNFYDILRKERVEPDIIIDVLKF